MVLRPRGRDFDRDRGRIGDDSLGDESCEIRVVGHSAGSSAAAAGPVVAGTPPRRASGASGLPRGATRLVRCRGGPAAAGALRRRLFGAPALLSSGGASSAVSGDLRLALHRRLVSGGGVLDVRRCLPRLPAATSAACGGVRGFGGFGSGRDLERTRGEDAFLDKELTRAVARARTAAQPELHAIGVDAHHCRDWAADRRSRSTR